MTAVDLFCRCMGIDGDFGCYNQASGEDGLCDTCRHDGGLACDACPGCSRVYGDPTVEQWTCADGIEHHRLVRAFADALRMTGAATP